MSCAGTVIHVAFFIILFNTLRKIPNKSATAITLKWFQVLIAEDTIVTTDASYLLILLSCMSFNPPVTFVCHVQQTFSRVNFPRCTFKDLQIFRNQKIPQTNSFTSTLTTLLTMKSIFSAIGLLTSHIIVQSGNTLIFSSEKHVFYVL